MMPTQPSLPQPELPERLPLIHPGEILQLDFLEPMQITAYRLSQDIVARRERLSRPVEVEWRDRPQTNSTLA